MSEREAFIALLAGRLQEKADALEATWRGLLDDLWAVDGSVALQDAPGRTIALEPEEPDPEAPASAWEAAWEADRTIYVPKGEG